MITYKICNLGYEYPIGIINNTCNSPPGNGQLETIEKKSKQKTDVPITFVKNRLPCIMRDECYIEGCPYKHPNIWCPYNLICNDPYCQNRHSYIPYEPIPLCTNGEQCMDPICPSLHVNDWCADDTKCNNYSCKNRHSTPICSNFVKIECKKYNNCPLRHPMDFIDRYNKGIECHFGKNNCPYECVLFHSITKEEIEQMQNDIKSETYFGSSNSSLQN